jgi:hypothetical protein
MEPRDLCSSLLHNWRESAMHSLALRARIEPKPPVCVQSIRKTL